MDKRNFSYYKDWFDKNYLRVFRTANYIFAAAMFLSLLSYQRYKTLYSLATAAFFLLDSFYFVVNKRRAESIVFGLLAAFFLMLVLFRRGGIIIRI